MACVGPYQLLVEGEIIEARGWAVVQLSHANMLCPQPGIAITMENCRA